MGYDLTTNYSFRKPILGTFRNEWPVIWRYGLDQIDTVMHTKFDKGGGTITAATSITANLKVGANTADVSYTSGQPLAAVTNANSRVDIVVRNADSGSSAGAGLVINPHGNSWRMGAGSAARDSNRLRWEIDALGSPVEIMGLGASGGLDVIGNVKAHLASASNSTFRGLSWGVINSTDDFGGVRFRADTGVVRYTAGFSGWGGSHEWYANGALAMQLSSAGSLTNLTGVYGTISDAKLKRDVTDTGPKLSKVLAMRIVNYFLIADPTDTKMLGMIAQELRAISPGLVDEVPDLEDVIVEPARVDTVLLQRQRTEPRAVTRWEVQVNDGVAVRVPVEEMEQTPVFVDMPLVDEDGQPVMNLVDGELVQAVYRHPVMEDYTKHVEVPAKVESRETGTTTLSIKYSILLPMLIKAFQEMHADFDGRLSALEA
jgi:hypothetical protein